MKFVEDQKYVKGNLPLKVIGMTHVPELMVELRERKD